LFIVELAVSADEGCHYFHSRPHQMNLPSRTGALVDDVLTFGLGESSMLDWNTAHRSVSSRLGLGRMHCQVDLSKSITFEARSERPLTVYAIIHPLCRGETCHGSKNW
jgi:hypothetical protein